MFFPRNSDFDVAGDGDLFDFEENLPDEELLTANDFGACCSCGAADGIPIRTLITLNKSASIPGTGWGCVICQLPADGAMAIICDRCADQKPRPEIKWAIYGYAKDKQRCQLTSLTQPFSHDPLIHQALEEDYE